MNFRMTTSKNANQQARPAIAGRRYIARCRLKHGIGGAIPFLDVIMLIFIFFLLSARFVLQPGISVNLPASAFEDGVPYGGMILMLSQEGMMFFNDERITMAELQMEFQRAARKYPEDTLIVEADGKVPYDKLIQIYNRARAAGIEEVALGTRISAVNGEQP